MATGPEKGHVLHRHEHPGHHGDEGHQADGGDGQGEAEEAQFPQAETDAAKRVAAGKDGTVAEDGEDGRHQEVHQLRRPMPVPPRHRPDHHQVGSGGKAHGQRAAPGEGGAMAPGRPQGPGQKVADRQRPGRGGGSFVGHHEYSSASWLNRSWARDNNSAPKATEP